MSYTFTVDELRAMGPIPHEEGLSALLMFAARRPNEDPLIPPKLALCRSFIDAGLVEPSSGMLLMHSFVSMRGWGADTSATELFRAYVAAGVLQVNAPILKTLGTPSAYPNRALPLEAAVMYENVDALRALLEAGADPTLVPGPFYKVAKVRDIQHFINQRSPASEVGDQMKAVLREFAMAATIDAEVGSSNPASTRRRPTF